jgi:ferric-dicitrate binding protein FerR (iron transport regulator)
MDGQAYRVAYLIAGYIRNTLTDKEHQELDDWINSSDHNMKLFEDLTDEQNIESNLEWMDKVQSERSFKELQESGAFQKPTRKNRMNPVWIAAASIVLLTMIFLVYRYMSGNRSDNNSIITLETPGLQPGGNRATLTLADGAVIDLTTAKNGSILNKQGSHVNKPADGELVYEEKGSLEAPMIHTLSTPVGGQYQLTLSDGTKVWLNAATTLKYPSHFTSSERKVELSGEAYFEVSKNEKQPFYVFLSDSSGVKVLGTHFNVSSYTNENEKQITLLEGSVLVTTKSHTTKLEPGSQAHIVDNLITKSDNVDTEEIVGWKNGLFVFHDVSIETIMRQVERWYNAKVIFKGEIKQQFNATILRNEPLSKLLHLLELNGYVHFKIENKTIYVLP